MKNKLICVAVALGSTIAGVAVMPGVALAASPRCISVTPGEGKPHMESRDSLIQFCKGSDDNGPHVVVDGRNVRF